MVKLLKKNLILLLTVLSILILFSLRFYNLTILPVFADEAIYIRWAQIMKAEETLRFLPLSDGKQPLFMWMVIPFLKVISDPLIAGRIVSVFSGFGTLAGVYYISYLLFNSKKTRLVAALIYAVAPYTFFFNRLALADSMLAMFGIWTFVFSYLAVKTERLDFAMIAGFMLGGAWLTKSPALFFAIMLPTIWLFSRNIKSLIKVIPLTLVTLVIGYGMYNILRLGPNFHLISSRNADYVYPLNHFLTSPLNPFKVFLTMSFEWMFGMGPSAIFILFIISVYINYKKRFKEILVLGIWFLGPILIQSEFAQVFTARYILFSIPFLIVLASGAFDFPSAKWQKLLVFILAFLFAQAILFDKHLLLDPEKAPLHRSERSGYLEEWTAGHGIFEISEIIKAEQNKNPTEKIVVGTEGFFGTLPDGLQMYLNNERKITVIGVGLNFEKLSDQLVNAKKSGAKTYLVVNSDRFNADAQKQGLSLVASYPKALRPNGTKQSLLLFEVAKIQK